MGRFAGRFAVERLAGMGGMGRSIVPPTQTGQPVALKILRTHEREALDQADGSALYARLASSLSYDIPPS